MLFWLAACGSGGPLDLPDELVVRFDYAEIPTWKERIGTVDPNAPDTFCHPDTENHPSFADADSKPAAILNGTDQDRFMEAVESELEDGIGVSLSVGQVLAAGEAGEVVASAGLACVGDEPPAPGTYERDAVIISTESVGTDLTGEPVEQALVVVVEIR